MDLPSPLSWVLGQRYKLSKLLEYSIQTKFLGNFSNFNIICRHQEKHRNDPVDDSKFFSAPKIQPIFPIILSSLGTASDGSVYRFFHSQPNLLQNFPIQKHLGKHYTWLFSVVFILCLATERLIPYRNYNPVPSFACWLPFRREKSLM